MRAQSAEYTQFKQDSKAKIENCALLYQASMDILHFSRLYFGVFHWVYIHLLFIISYIFCECRFIVLLLLIVHL